jgi:hypothetical protein
MKLNRANSAATLIAAILGLALVIPAHAVPQSESAESSVGTFSSASEIATADSSSVRGAHPVSALPAGPGMGTPAATPAAALIAPVRNENRVTSERPTLPKKTFISLTLLNHGAVAFDSWSTRRLVDSGGRELNPLLKPIAGSNALYPVMQTWPTAIDYLAARMARSDKPWMRKMWWMPQTVSAASSIVIGFRNVSLANSSHSLVK